MEQKNMNVEYLKKIEELVEILIQEKKLNEKRTNVKDMNNHLEHFKRMSEICKNQKETELWQMFYLDAERFLFN